MTNWNKRLAELQAKQSEKPLTNKELFESEEYRDFTQKAAGKRHLRIPAPAGIPHHRGAGRRAGAQH